jgi:hypothetical protein
MSEIRPRPEREADLLRLLDDELRLRLPRSWQFEVTREPRYGRRRPDALLRIEAPDGTSAQLLVEAKMTLNARDVPDVLRRLGEARDEARGERFEEPLVIGRYIAPRTRAMLAEAGVSYLDATGNLRFQIDRPAIFVAADGADSDPWRGPERETRTLRGRPATRVVRALIDFRPPLGIRELSSRSGASLGSTSRTVDLLDREALVEREGRGTITAVDWPNLLTRWSEDYSFQGSNQVRPVLEPRGLDRLLVKLAEYEGRYAITGALSGRRVSEVATPRTAMIFTSEPGQLADVLGLRDAEGAANVLLARPFDDVVFDRGRIEDDVSYAAYSQTAVDLLGGPGRDPAEGEALIEWMAANEGDWRG